MGWFHILQGDSAVTSKLQEVREAQFLFKICPNHELSTSNVLKWIVRDVKTVLLQLDFGAGHGVSSSEAMLNTTIEDLKGKQPRTLDPDYTNTLPLVSPITIIDDKHLAAHELEPACTPPFTSVVKDNAVPRQANAASGRLGNRKSPAIRLNFNDTSYAELQEDGQQTSEREMLAGESQANEIMDEAELGFDE